MEPEALGGLRAGLRGAEPKDAPGALGQYRQSASRPLVTVARARGGRGRKGL